MSSMGRRQRCYITGKEENRTEQSYHLCIIYRPVWLGYYLDGFNAANYYYLRKIHKQYPAYHKLQYADVNLLPCCKIKTFITI